VRPVHVPPIIAEAVDRPGLMSASGKASIIYM